MLSLKSDGFQFTTFSLADTTDLFVLTATDEVSGIDKIGGGAFDGDFAASLGAPILVGADDPPDVAIVKAAVAKAKEKIAAAMANGQRPSEVVTAMRDEMNRVADYRDLLQEDFDKVKETEMAHQIEAYLKEANQLLDEFGVEHLDLPEDELVAYWEAINDKLRNLGIRLVPLGNQAKE